MLRKRYIYFIFTSIVLVIVSLALLFMNKELVSITKVDVSPSYANSLFDDSQVHTIDIVIDDWDNFLKNATGKEYVSCTLIINGETFDYVGLRAKGNNSLNLINKYGLDRYSLKIEFDHYLKGRTYYGLDKFSLDTSFQDNSYMKNYLSFDMMESMQVPASLCSYVWLKVNGEDWGLFLAIEEPEEAFALRNFGPDHGQLYKPGYKSLSHENADVALRYIDDDPESYDNIFRNSKFNVSAKDKQRLIKSLKILSTGENLATAINVDEVLRYFTVQVFTVNMDSYLGHTGHNYFLYEKDGILSIIPWDYNLAFATYSLGMPNPINDAELYINYPIDTPAAGNIMFKRPLYHNIMLNREYFSKYHEYFDQFISNYFESGFFEEKITATAAMIAPYVERDPTAFCSYDDFLLAADTLKQFCLLRAESVRGQLDGTIPSTIKGQSEDRSNFIDASNIWLPDLGEIDDLK